MLRHSTPLRLTLTTAGLVLLGACSGDSPTNPRGFSKPDLSCTIPESEIFAGQIRDGIPALSELDFGFFGSEGTETWREQDRVIGMIVGDQPIAIPLNIFWWHEIVNLDFEGESIAITHCPLTGSSLAFDREPLGGVEFGVSGLLYRNNLMMYDRSGDTESFWPQMSRGARCGPQSGTELDMLALVETTYRGWVEMHPNTLVATTNGLSSRNYSDTGYPYGDYDQPDNPELLFPVPQAVDHRFPPKERVLGVPSGTGGRAFAYSELAKMGDNVAVTVGEGEEQYVVLFQWARQGAMAYRPVADGQPLTLDSSSGFIIDLETESNWNINGVATSGPLVGSRLEPVHEAFVAFWFSWPLFYPDIEPWRFANEND
ncbi:MAG: DUF3179 domain-containing protein [Gemmatimonadota bacterium]